MSETSTKPYLLRALYEWCTDNGYTPHIAVVVDAHTQVPREFVKGGEIVLNIGALATHQLQLGNDFVQFQARFGGVAREIIVPIGNISAIYARETGNGMAFEIEHHQPDASDSLSVPAADALKQTVAPVLKAVPSAVDAVVEKKSTSSDSSSDSNDSPPTSDPNGHRPKLTRIK